MLIRNIYIFNPITEKRELKHVLIHEGNREIIDPNHSLPHAEKIIEANANYTLMPGLLDSHVHGQGGPDFADVGYLPEDQGVAIITQALGKTGLSYAMATLVSLELPTLKKALRVIDTYIKNQEEKGTLPGSTKIVGVHLEGPFIAKNCKGAHAESALQDSISLEKFKEIIGVAPHVKQWKITLAPDLEGALNFIEEVKILEQEEIYVQVFIGHCNPNQPEISVAIQAGAKGFTHLGNACQETCCREARNLEKIDATSHVVKWVLDHPDECPSGVELIVDGVHLSQSFVELMVKTLGNKIVLVTDALGPSGLSDGLYKLGTLNIRKENNNFYLADEAGQFIMKEGKLPDGQLGQVKTLSGSAASLTFCAQTYFNWTRDLFETEEDRMRAIYHALIANPRKTSLSVKAIDNLPDHKNFVVFDKEGDLVMSLCNGHLMHHQKKNLIIHDSIEPGLLSNHSFMAQRGFKSNINNDLDSATLIQRISPKV